MKTKNRKTLFIQAASLALAAVLTSGCAKDVYQRGNAPLPESLAQLAPGEQTRQDVQGLLGTPATTSVFGDETWYYISAQTTQYAFYPVHELERAVLALEFDNRGILQSVQELTLAEGRNVAIAQRATPTKGREYGILEQLIGNIGRFGTQGDRGPGGLGGPGGPGG
jgi:outer membrane protein assembly factor BamE (lipoprotein component of BamABCDE complex)